MTYWQRTADLVLNLLMLGYLVWLSGVTVTRWIRRGRIESYSEASLMPKWLRRPWFERSEPTDAEGRRPSSGAGFIAWVLVASIVVWVFAQVIKAD